MLELKLLMTQTQTSLHLTIGYATELGHLKPHMKD